MPALADAPAASLTHGRALVSRLEPIRAREAVRARVTRARAGAAVAAVLVAACVIRFGLTPRMLIAAFVVSILVVMSLIDIAERRLPNRIVLPSTAVVLAAQIATAPERTAEWLLAAAGAALFLLLPLLVAPSGVGMGDVKLALLLGAALGAAVIVAVVVAAVASSLYGVALLLRHGSAARKASMPFGPFLAFGAIVALLLG